MEEKKLVMDLIQAIEKASSKELVCEFQYPYVPEVSFMIAYASKQLLKRMIDEAREYYFDSAKRQQEERINDIKFNRAVVKHLIKGWKGLTIGRLKKMLVTLDISGDDDVDVPFDEDLAYVILDNCLEFQNWVTNVSTNAMNFHKVAEKKKEEYENLE